MSKAFDGLIRPFQQDNSAPAVKVVTPGQQEVKRILLSFGRAGSGKVMQGSSSLNKTFYVKQHIVEKTQAETDLGSGPDFGGGISDFESAHFP